MQYGIQTLDHKICNCLLIFFCFSFFLIKSLFVLNKKGLYKEIFTYLFLVIYILNMFSLSELCKTYGMTILRGKK